MILHVMPKAPLEAIQYIGHNIEEIWAFDDQITNHWDDGEPYVESEWGDVDEHIPVGSWIVRVPAWVEDDGLDEKYNERPSADKSDKLVVMSDEYFKAKWREA